MYLNLVHVGLPQLALEGEAGMLWAGRIIAGLWVMTYGYAWTVGQGGLAPVDRNLCDLWDAVFWKAAECHPHQFLLPLWQIGAFIAAVFLVVDFVRARNRAERPKLETFLWVILVIGVGVSAASAVGLWRMHNTNYASAPPSISTEAPVAVPATQGAPPNYPGSWTGIRMDNVTGGSITNNKTDSIGVSRSQDIKVDKNEVGPKEKPREKK
jgi:hypothetical protein